MDKGEAQAIQTRKLEELRGLTDSQLVEQLVDQKPITSEVTADSGTAYQLEIEGWWNRRAGSDLRVAVRIDDGGLRAFSPLGADFIIRPDGSFVDE